MVTAPVHHSDTVYGRGPGRHRRSVEFTAAPAQPRPAPPDGARPVGRLASKEHLRTVVAHLSQSVELSAAAGADSKHLGRTLVFRPWPARSLHVVGESPLAGEVPAASPHPRPAPRKPGIQGRPHPAAQPHRMPGGRLTVTSSPLYQATRSQHRVNPAPLTLRRVLPRAWLRSYFRVRCTGSGIRCSSAPEPPSRRGRCRCRRRHRRRSGRAPARR
jgi:hypothetical protein